MRLSRLFAAVARELRRCGTCASFVPVADGAGIGWCHRMPPTFVSESVGPGGEYTAQAAWPTVNATLGWCREHERR